MVRRCRTTLLYLWRRQDHAPIPAHGEAEEVEAVVDVDDAGLRLAQLQSTLLKKCIQRGNNMPFQDLAGRCRHHQIIGIYPDTVRRRKGIASAG